jgi:LysM repeat protein
MRPATRGAVAIPAILAMMAFAPPARADGDTAASVVRPIDDFSPAFLGMYRKVMEIEPDIRKAAERYEVDLALAEAVCMYESGGNASLSSGAGARGYFQVMPATYRALGTGSNIEAGIKYLGQMVRQFGREDYALAAYNGGPTRVGRGGPMPLESLQDVLGVGGYRSVLKLYATPLRVYASTLGLTTVRAGDTWTSLAARLEVPLLQLRMHNPFLATRPLHAGYRIAYPQKMRPPLFARAGTESRYRVRIGDNYLKLAFTLGIDPDDLRASNGLWRLQAVLPGSLLVIPPDTSTHYATYTVKTADTLAGVAQRLNADPWWLIRDNALWDEVLTPGTTLRVRSVPMPRPAPAPAPKPRVVTHRVRAGENLTVIARRYDTTVGAIQRANALGRRTRIVPGQRLRIPAS